jgi:lipid A 3-O-deacylase
MRIRILACVALLSSPVISPSAQAAALGILDETRVGVLAHDIPLGDPHREPGLDINGELLFVSPDLLHFFWAPRPTLGTNINTAGKNSSVYFGLTWEANFTSLFFADLGLGGAVHTGPDNSTSSDHKGLGTRLLFHESLSAGFRITQIWNVSVYVDHISNANLGNHNPGVTDAGLRLGYVF